MFHHPALASRASRICLWVVSITRAFLFFALAISLDELVDFGTSPVLVALSAAVGTGIGALVAFSRLTSRGFLIGFVSAIALYFVGWGLLYRLPISLGKDFSLFSLQQHLDLILGAGAVGAYLTWMFWKTRHTITLEAWVILSATIYIFAGHRDLRLDTPRFVSSLAWDLHISPLTMFVTLGTFLTVAILTYFFVATLPASPVARRDTPKVHYYALARDYPMWIILGSAFLLLGYTIFTQVLGHFEQTSDSRLKNGVGEATQEGISPLGFHSALGANNQPAALVRLEGDYARNPFVPMLYLRESALSAFNGKEMVLAGREYDRDINNSSPREPYQGEEDSALIGRDQLAQSTYLLADHNLAFAVDYPLSIVRLKNPNPSRFKNAYRAYSLAPTEKILPQAGYAVGDPRWNDEQRRHYLVTHSDARYGEEARKITSDQGISDPVDQALALIAHLSKTSIYTLSPNHKVEPHEDQVAPFLFGDKRGYCVHFAHATVYMLRSLGIPSRIGTGYLTDLSEARDGNALLRMSDRHAWAEVYITGMGWMPFDTHPEQVESHADSPMDMKLLEELMGLLDPGEELLPEDDLKDEKNVFENSRWEVPSQRTVVITIGILLGIFVLLKLYLRLGYLIPGTTTAQARRSYLSLLAALADVGIRRGRGETKGEFRARVSALLGTTALTLTDPAQVAAYAPSPETRLSREEIHRERRHDFAALQTIPLWKRALGWVNPISLSLIATAVRGTFGGRK